MKYEFAPDLQEHAKEISRVLFPHVDLNRIRCLRSYGTSSKRTIARCHALGKLMQKAMGVEAFYAMEFLSERFDKMSSVDQIKVIIHELMHIPNTFGGGFRHHDHVTDGNVNKMYEKYINEIKRINQDDPLGLEFLKIQQKENELFTKKIKKPTRKGFFWR